MPRVRFTRHLNRFFNDLESFDFSGVDVAALVDEAGRRWPGLPGYLLEGDGSLRRHVNIFIDGRPVRDRRHLADSLEDAREVYIVQSLSGG